MSSGTTPARRPRNLPRMMRHGVLQAVSITVGAAVAVPIVFGVLGGFKDSGQLFTNPFGLPDPWVPGNYLEAVTSSAFWQQAANSTVIAVASTALVVLIGAMAAYIFARYAFPGRELLFTIFTIGLMFPFAVAILPLFVLLREMGLLNNPLGVVLPQAAFGLPVTIVILRAFFRSIPAEVEESAVLDGCGPFRFFWRILLPMSRPALGTVSILAVVGSWNNFLLPLIVFNDSRWWTLPLGVQQFQSQFSADTARILAYVTLAMLPSLVCYAFAERQLIAGLTSGIGKG
ncbi:carbohydrate ABC transporter permease [Actinoplanes sp. NEAU-A12]|uniref:Carbohydrate ABC transporter permease n=1 Tax=Actinoplanes sandaracinus TaxID=3045177 RepID=A0ABT6WGN1_9ACTN|nr:carbohydrate ABC transporter permease [Actinoplanes sandaracinus]MDI6098879.1 carbohydrate ABC transporter permease [Actinoplanes sandaracinus]